MSGIESLKGELSDILTPWVIKKGRREQMSSIGRLLSRESFKKLSSNSSSCLMQAFSSTDSIEINLNTNATKRRNTAYSGQSRIESSLGKKRHFKSRGEEE